jgi:hypothetical protein
MNKRPLSITVISWIFIAFGVIAIISILLPLFTAEGIQRLAALKARNPLEFWLAPVIRLLAGLSGLFMLYGFNWARWLLVAWMGYHIILSIFHSPFQLLMHILIFAVLLYFLFRPLASAYFRGTKVEPQIPIQS